MLNKKRTISSILIFAMPFCFCIDTGFAETEESATDTDTKPPVVKASSMKLDAKRLVFGKKGDTLKLVATVKPANASPVKIVFSSSDDSIATVNKNGKVKARNWGECTITAKVDGIKKTCLVSVAKKWVAITFDDGPGKYTGKLLKGLKKQNVQATFFVVGSMAKPRKNIIQKIDKNGHEIANHTYNHNAGAATLKNQLSKTDGIIKRTTGSKAKLMRPPGGVMNEMTRKCGKAVILWTIDPKDWRDRNSALVRNRVVSSAQSGSIILLHDIHPTSVDAALKITADLKKKGYTFVTVSDLIGKPQKNTVYFKGSSKVKTMKISY